MKKSFNFKLIAWFLVATFIASMPGSVYSMDTIRSKAQWVKTNAAKAKEKTLDRLVKKYRATQELRRKKAAGTATSAELKKLERQMRNIRRVAAAIGITLVTIAAIAGGIYGYRWYLTKAKGRGKEEKSSSEEDDDKYQTILKAIQAGDKDLLLSTIKKYEKRIEQKSGSAKEEAKKDSYLLQRGALLSAFDNKKYDMVQFLLENNAPIDWNMLTGAVDNKDVKMAGLLLKFAKLNSYFKSDNVGSDLLERSIWKNDAKMAELILTNYDKPKLKSSDAYSVISRKNIEMIKLFLDRGLLHANQKIDNKFPLEIAARYGNKPVVQMLLEEYKAPFNWSALVGAIKYDQHGIVALLLQKGTQEDKNDALVYVVSTDEWLGDEQNRIKMIDTLLKQGAEINSSNYSGLISLIQAVDKGKKAIVKFLLRKGADARVTDKHGRTPLEIAYRYRDENKELFDLIKAAVRMRVAEPALEFLPLEIYEQISEFAGVEL